MRDRTNFFLRAAAVAAFLLLVPGALLLPWSAIVFLILFLTALLALLGVKTRPSAQEDLQGAKTPERAAEEPRQESEKLPLTPENLEALMPGTSELSQADRDQMDAMIAEARKRIMGNRENRTEKPPRSPEETRKRLLAYGPLPVARAQKDDPDAVPLDVFSYEGKPDFGKIAEMLKEFEKTGFSSLPSPRRPARE